MILKYSVIGSDSKSISSLDQQLSNFEGFRKIGDGLNLNQLFDVILSGAPNLIFVDVSNYSKKTFADLKSMINDLYRSFPQKPFLVAYATTKKHAYKCIKNNFFYYLLKPFSPLQLQKLKYKLKTTSAPPTAKKPNKICLKTYRDYRFVEIDEIVYLKSDSNTTEIFLLNQTKIHAYKTLKHFETILPHVFHRIHQSYIINQKYISRIHFGKSECHLKPLQTRVPFSKSHKVVMNDLATSLLSNALK